MKIEITRLVALAFVLAAVISGATHAQQNVARCNLQIINPANGGAYMEARASVTRTSYWTFTGSRATPDGQADFSLSGWVQPSRQRAKLAQVQLSSFYSTNSHPSSMNGRIIRYGRQQEAVGRYGYDVMIIADLRIYDQNNQIICERDYSRPNQGPHHIFSRY